MKKLAYVLPLVTLSLIVFVSQARAVMLPGGEALFETSLQSRISATDTSMTLVANSVGGSAISGYHCFTIDEGRSDAEFVCGTVAGTSVTGLTRGLSYINGTSTIPSLAFIHRVGADVKITDFPLVQIMQNILNGIETIPNVLHYTSGTTVSGSDSQALVNVALLNATAISGASNSSETVNGISQLATGAQASAGTATGSTAARLVLPASLATSTCQVAQSSVLVASSTTGKLDGHCFNGAYSYSFSGQNIFTGNNVFSATTTMATTTAASSTVSTLNAGTINVTTFNGPSPLIPHYSLAINNSFVSNSGTAATSTALIIPANVLSASSTMSVAGNIGNCSDSNTDTTTCTVSLYDSLTYTKLATCSINSQSSGGGTTGNFYFTVGNQSSLSAQSGLSTCIGAANNGAGFTSGGTTNTSTLNTAVKTSLVIGIVNGATATNATMTLNNFMVTVNP